MTETTENVITGFCICLIVLVILGMTFAIGEDIKKAIQCRESGGVWLDRQCLDLPKLEL